MFAVEIQGIRNRYFEKTAKSRSLNSKAANFLPDGDTRVATYFEPYCPYMVKGEGCYVFDADGNRYIDYMNNYTTLIHGHNHPKIKKAVARQLEFGTILGAPHQTQYELAETLCDRMHSIEKIRFCSSGTEATMFAIRAARAHTGRNKVIKTEGGFHGAHDIVEASVSPSIEEAGDPNLPKIIPCSQGIPKSVFENVLIVPFNNIEALGAIVRTNKDDLAAIIVEPVMGAAGMITATKEYLKFVRKITREYKILLIFDEIISFRLSQGGAQDWYEVTPDLTALGKIIGGGFPIGAFGGREDIMALFSPKKGNIHHSGTFNGHPISMVAGLTALKEMTPDAYKRINSLGDSLRRGINDLFHELSIKAKAGGVGSLVFIHYTLDEIMNYRDARKAREQAKILTDLTNLCFLNHGIYIAARGQFAVSTPMTEEHINQTIDSIHESFLELKPVIEQFLPHLIK